jgi:dipeptidyl aminopeptidase/acylaminoacyl peptidase
MRAIVLLALVLAAPAQEEARGRMSPELLWRLGRLAAARLSPDGGTLLYGVTRTDLAKNSSDLDLFLLDLATGEERALSVGPGSERDFQWVRTASGLRVFCISTRSGDAQVWAIDPGSDAWTQVTSVEGGVANLVVAATGDRIAFTREIPMDPGVRDLHPDLPLAEARIYDGLMFRHWDSWEDGAFRHVHVATLGPDLRAQPAVDLMEGLRADCPLPPFGGPEQIAFAPDGREIALTLKLRNDWATSTDSGIYVCPLGGPRRLRCVSPGLPGYDQEPLYSPDGRYLAWLSMERAGFEADRNRILLQDRGTGELRELMPGFDRSAHSLRWSADGRHLVFRFEDRGTEQLGRIGVEGGLPDILTRGDWNWSPQDVSADGRTVFATRESWLQPKELCAVDAASGEVRVLTDLNGPLLGGLAQPRVEARWIPTTDGRLLHAWMAFPPDFDPARKHPILLYCQGGPQSQVGQFFSLRWNFHLMAARGYVVLAPNRRGLPGFGQEWNDRISGDWGGQAMADLLAAIDDVLTEPWADARRVAAIGASFGGYTAYWMMGRGEDRFAAIVAHCGVFNLESMYGSTEELFFVNWDLGGPYWSSDAVQAAYDVFSPHRFVGRWKTPLLVIHGEKDFRVPLTQGIEAFTAAQVRGVPSRFLYFPTEGHWVLSPQNSVLWQRVVFDWLDRYLREPR